MAQGGKEAVQRGLVEAVLGAARAPAAAPLPLARTAAAQAGAGAAVQAGMEAALGSLAELEMALAAFEASMAPLLPAAPARGAADAEAEGG